MTVLGEVAVGPTPDDLIVVNVPVATMNKFIMYKSSWTIGFDYLTTGGTQPLPYVGLAFSNLLAKITALSTAYTMTTSAPYTVDDNPDYTDGVGSTFGRLVQSVKNIFDNGNFTLSGSTTLSAIPVEAIKSITTTGLVITALTSIFLDIETPQVPTTYTPALQDMFEQAVAYNRIGITGTAVSSGDIPAAFNMVKNTTTPNDWVVHSVQFQESDSIVLYVKYTIGKIRRYGIDPTVAAGLDPTFSLAPVLTLTFAGRTFDIPIGSKDPNNLGADQDTEGDSSTITRLYGIKLVATSAASHF